MGSSAAAGSIGSGTRADGTMPTIWGCIYINYFAADKEGLVTLGGKN